MRQRTRSSRRHPRTPRVGLTRVKRTCPGGRSKTATSQRTHFVCRHIRTPRGGEKPARRTRPISLCKKARVQRTRSPRRHKWLTPFGKANTGKIKLVDLQAPPIGTCSWKWTPGILTKKRLRMQSQQEDACRSSRTGGSARRRGLLLWWWFWCAPVFLPSGH